MRTPTLATIAAGLLAVSMATACGGQTPSPQPAPAAPDGPVQPKVNRVVMGLVPPMQEENAYRNVGSPDSWQLRGMYEWLVGVNAESGKLEPQLATAWSVEAGNRVRFKLRAGVPFHGDNGTFSSADFVHTLQDRQREDGSSSTAAFLRRTIKSVDVASPAELVVELTSPQSNFFNLVGEPDGTFAIQSKVHADKVGDLAIDKGTIAGTGPYQFKSRALGQNLVLERASAKHWRATPDFPEFEFRYLREASTRLASLLTGEVHLVNLPEDLLAQAESRGMRVLKARVPAQRVFLNARCCFLNDPEDVVKGWVFPQTPMLDVRVRRALSKAIDRDAINKAFFQGKGETTILNHFHPTRQGWNPDWEKRFAELYGYDQAKARALLAEAGYTADRPLETNLFILAVASVSNTEDMLEAIGGAWRSVGVKVNLISIDAARINAGTREKRWDNHWNLGVSNASQYLGFSAYNSQVEAARGLGIETGETNALFKTVISELDPAKQDAAWRALGDKYFDTNMTIPLFWVPTQIVVNKDIVADYVFPGSVTGTWTHLEQVKAAR